MWTFPVRYPAEDWNCVVKSLAGRFMMRVGSRRA